MKPAWSLDRAFVSVATLVGGVLAFLLSLGFDLAGLAKGPVSALLLLPPAFAALLAWRSWAWTYLACAITIALLAVASIAFGGLAALGNPASPNDFGVAVVLLATAIVVVPSGVRGFVARVRRRPAPVSRGAWGRPDVLLVLLVAGVVLGAVATSTIAARHERVTATTAIDAAAPDATVALATSGFAFSPSTIHVARGVLTQIEVTNDDPTLHTFTYEAGGKTYVHELLPGATTRFLVKLDAAGTVPFWCQPHAPGMAGEIVVG